MTPKESSPRLLLLGDARQVHLKRWARYFCGAGYDVLAFSLQEADAFPARLRVLHFPRLLPDVLRYPLAAPAAARAIRSFSPHVVNAHFVPNYGLIAALAGRSPWVLSTWGSDVMTEPDKGAFHGWRVRYVLRRAAYVTSDAEVMSERLRSFGVPADRVLTFPYGVDTDRFRPRPTPSEGGPRIVTTRKLWPVYSVATVLDAFQGVHEAFPEATLTVAGDGSQRSELVARADRSIASAAITFVGSVDHDRMPALLADNQIYVSAALSDTTSVSLLEAMACGLFPVVTDIPANREWITDGTNGFLVPREQPLALASAIIEAWRRPDLVRAAREANLALIHRRARWSESMKAVHELFDRLAGGRPGQATA